jgi:hypothetical protein
MRSKMVLCRVARWYIFKPNIPIWVNFVGSCNGRCLYILVYHTAIWYILCTCGHLVIFPRFGILYMQRKIRQPWFSAEMIFSGPSSLVREKKRNFGANFKKEQNDGLRLPRRRLELWVMRSNPTRV